MTHDEILEVDVDVVESVDVDVVESVDDAVVESVDDAVVESVDDAVVESVDVGSGDAAGSAEDALPTDSAAARGTAIPDGDAAALIGKTIGKYEVLSLLGCGGMADVYLVRHRDLGRRFALKRLKEVKQADLVNRFFEEARGVSQLYHPNIVEITDFVRTPEHQCYVMEYLEGQTVEELLMDIGEIPAIRAVHIALQLCNALDVLHRMGVIHRDIKPANLVLIKRQGTQDFVKVLDFGIARFLEDDTGVSRNQTAIGMSLGTPGYMAPEQLFGSPVDVRADIYAVGVLLYQMVTGKKPFISDTWAKLILKQTTENPRPPSEVTNAGIPPALEALILECLELRREDRPKEVGEVIERLERIHSAPRGITGEPRRRRSGKRLFFLAAGVVAAGLVAGGLAMFYTNRSQENAPVTVETVSATPSAEGVTDAAEGSATPDAAENAISAPADAKKVKKKRTRRPRRRGRAPATGSDKLFDQFE